MDYSSAMFGDFGLSRFGFIVRTDRQTDRITETDQRYTDATTIDVSNWPLRVCKTWLYLPVTLCMSAVF